MTTPAKKSIVVTTINEPTSAVGAVAKRHGWDLIVIGDNETPPDRQLEGARFVPISEQRDSQWRLAKAGVPENHYCRKNLGYLEAIKDGAAILAETDDDNLPGDWPPLHPERQVSRGFVSSTGVA